MGRVQRVRFGGPDIPEVMGLVYGPTCGERTDSVVNKGPDCNYSVSLSVRKY